MSKPTVAVLEAWIEASWPHGRPPWAYEVFREMYTEEQRHRAVEQAKDWRNREITELRARVAKLEKILGRRGENLINGISKAAGITIRNVRAEDRERLLGEIESRDYVTYAGTWDETAEYARGALVTHAGGAWVAVAPVAKGERPGKGPSWKLAVKSDSRAPVTA
jgi:hypothetical protein